MASTELIFVNIEKNVTKTDVSGELTLHLGYARILSKVCARKSLKSCVQYSQVSIDYLSKI